MVAALRENFLTDLQQQQQQHNKSGELKNKNKKTMAGPWPGANVPNSMAVDQFLSSMRVASSGMHRTEENPKPGENPVNPAENSPSVNFAPPITSFPRQPHYSQAAFRQTVPGYHHKAPYPNEQHFRLRPPRPRNMPYRQRFHEPQRMPMNFSRPPPPSNIDNPWTYNPPGPPATSSQHPINQANTRGNFSPANSGPNPVNPRPSYPTPRNVSSPGGDFIMGNVQQNQFPHAQRHSAPLAQTQNHSPRPQMFGHTSGFSRAKIDAIQSDQVRTVEVQNGSSQTALCLDECSTRLLTEQNPQRKQDQEWVDKWLQDLNIQKKVTPRKTVVTIANYKCCVQEALKLRMELANLTSAIQLDVESDQWQQQFDQIDKVQQRLVTLNQILTDEVTLENIKHLCEKRKKKRERLTRQRREQFQERQAQQDRRELLHQTIDAVQDRLLQKSLQQKQDKDMKVVADKILSEVRRKLAETDKTMEMITGLRKLRELRCQSVYTKGMYLGMESDNRFDTQTGSLLTLLENQKKIYETEEKTLKVMLETEQEETKEREREEQRRLQEHKERREQRLRRQALFGKEDRLVLEDPLLPYKQFYRQAESSLESLVAVRQGWDMFLVPEPIPGSSSIPNEWVWPSEPSSDVWTSVIKQ